MKIQGNKMIWLLAAAFILLSAFRADKPVVTIFMIGDSTMANKKMDGGNPERGWGMVLPGFFSEDVRIDNHAVNGRSSKSFISEGRWEKVISKVKKGDYVFIQFGHNDEKRILPVIPIRELLSTIISVGLSTKPVRKAVSPYYSIPSSVVTLFSRKTLLLRKTSDGYPVHPKSSPKKEPFCSILMGPIWILPAMLPKSWE